LSRCFIMWPANSTYSSLSYCAGYPSRSRLILIINPIWEGHPRTSARRSSLRRCATSKFVPLLTSALIENPHSSLFFIPRHCTIVPLPLRPSLINSRFVTL
jgi:hypothetical protein